MTSHRIALVTGGNRGLGNEACRQLAKQGCQVWMTGRDIHKVRDATAKLQKEGLDVKAIAMDMSRSESISTVADQLAKDSGRLDVLINNAALLLDLNIQPSAVDDDALEASFNVNFFGPYRLTRQLAPLIAASSGRVLNMATQVATLAQLSDPNSPLKDDICPAYQASKIALNAMTVLFAKELAPSGAKVNSVCPGWVLTDMGHEDLPEYGEAAKPQTPEQAVAAYLWLTGTDANLPNGSFFSGRKRVAW